MKGVYERENINYIVAYVISNKKGDSCVVQAQVAASSKQKAVLEVAKKIYGYKESEYVRNDELVRLPIKDVMDLMRYAGICMAEPTRKTEVPPLMKKVNTVCLKPAMTA